MSFKNHLKKQLREGLQGAIRGLSGGLQGKTYGQYKREQEVQLCEDCFESPGSTKCIECGGEGKVERINLQNGTKFSTLCNPCNGSGKCRVCDGEGIRPPTY